MRNFISYIKQKIAFIGAIIVAAIIGGASTALVAAAIPDGSGVIHGCYKNSTGALKVIDSDNGGGCASGETALNWNQTGPQGPQGGAGGPIAYAHITTDSLGNAIVDSANSQHITNAYWAPTGYICFEFDSTIVNPHTILANPESPNSAGNVALANISPGTSLVAQNCNSGADGLADIGGSSGFIVVY